MKNFINKFAKTVGEALCISMQFAIIGVMVYNLSNTINHIKEELK